MGQPPSDKELKRLGRVLAGHQADKDRARWKRKVKGEAGARLAPKKHAADDDEAVTEALGAVDAPDHER